MLRGTGDQAQATDEGDTMLVYDVPTGEVKRLLYFRQQKDPYKLYYDAESWSADSRHILIMQGKAISWAQAKFEPDLYLVTVPDTEAAPAAPAACPRARRRRLLCLRQPRLRPPRRSRPLGQRLSRLRRPC